IFIVFVASGFISKIGYQYRNALVYTSQVVEGSFQIFAVLLIINNYTLKHKTLSLSVSSLYCIHCFGLAFLVSDSSFSQNIKSNIVIINWYLFVFVLFLSYKKYIEKYSRFSEAILSFLKKCFELYFYLNFVAVIIGFLGNYELFSAYIINSRFGFDGLIRN